MGPDKTALSSYIRLFEPMVIKALKVRKIACASVYACSHTKHLYVCFFHSSCTQSLHAPMYKNKFWIFYAN